MTKDPEQKSPPIGYVADISDFQQDPKNANLHTVRGQGMVTNSQQKRGFARPGFTDNEGNVLGGNLSVMEVPADIGLGEGKVFVVESDGDIPILHRRRDVEPESEAAILLALEDNQSSVVSVNFDPVQLLQRQEEGVDLSNLFYESEMADILNKVETPPGEDEPPLIDKAEELQKKWGTELGQVWQIESKSLPGKYHRLICGDCRTKDDINTLLDGVKVNGVFTSPPYAMQRAKQYGGVETDKYVEWWDAVQENVRAVLAEDGSFFVNIKPHCEGGQRVLYVMDLALAMVRLWGWRLVDELCWLRRGYPGGFDNRFRNAFEAIYHFSTNNKIKCYPSNVLIESSIARGHSPNKSTWNNQTGSGIGALDFDDDLTRPSNVLDIKATAYGLPQAAAFPLPLPTFFIKAFSDPGDIWLDPFCGSGTVIAASESEKRLGMGVEKLPKYCAVILERLLTMTGNQPELIALE